MKYYVNENCIGCAMCEGICPGVFQMVGGTAQAIDADVDVSDELSAEETKNSCPVNAIEELL